MLYGAGGANSTPTDTIVYDTIGEPGFDPDDAASNTNVNRICIGSGEGATVGAFDLVSVFAELALPAEEQDLQTLPDRYLFQPPAPFAPYDCTGVELVAPNVDAP